MDRMRAALRRRDLFATPSLRYADPRLGLLDGAAWEAARPAVCRSLGVWVLAIGLMRYAFAAAAVVVPRLRAQLPFSRARKVVAAMQGGLLVVAAAPFVPQPVAAALVAVALVALVWSFGRDVRWLLTHPN